MRVVLIILFIVNSAYGQLVVGNNSLSGSQSVGIGNNLSATGAWQTALGYGVFMGNTETGAVCIGHGATITAGVTGGGQNVGIGQQSVIKAWRGTGVGYKSKVTAVSGTAIGRGALVTIPHGIAIGRGAWTGTEGDISIGFGGDTPVDVYFGSGHTHKRFDSVDMVTITATPSLTPIVIHGFDAFDATTSPVNNIAGGDLINAAGKGTGIAPGGNYIIQTSPAGTFSNNIKNNAINRVIVDASGNVGIGGIANKNTILDLQSNSKGFMPSRLTCNEVNLNLSNLTLADEGLIIYVKDTGCGFSKKGWYGWDGDSFEILNN